MKVFGIYNPVLRALRLCWLVIVAVAIGFDLCLVFSESRDFVSFLCVLLFILLLFILNRRRLTAWFERHRCDPLGYALRSLPWYLVGTFLFGPLIAAPFTGFASLAWYLLPAGFFDKTVPLWSIAAMVFGPGLLLWILRQFVRVGVSFFLRNRAAY